MYINRDFIYTLVNNFHNELNNHDEWCDAHDFEPTNDVYRKVLYQKIYAIRYLPAYYFEYCVLASKLNTRVRNDYNSLNIVSFGCGLAPDYYALRDNLASVAFNYLGYDAVAWSTKKFMPSINNNAQFILQNIGNIKNGELLETDMYVFPKSIGDIARSGTGIIENLASLIASTRLCCINPVTIELPLTPICQTDLGHGYRNRRTQLGKPI